MCGRFGASFQYRDIKVLWNLRGDLPEFGPRYNIASSQEVPLIIRNEDRNEVKPMLWGLVQSWAQDPSVGQRMINARSETLLEKPSFKQLVARRRCLVPADGFYEWRREGKRKVPLYRCLTSFRLPLETRRKLLTEALRTDTHSREVVREQVAFVLVDWLNPLGPVVSAC